MLEGDEVNNPLVQILVIFTIIQFFMAITFIYVKTPK